MKRVVALLGSNRRKNTYGLLSQVGQILEKHGTELTVVELYRKKIQPCLGCESCILRGKCVLEDDMGDIMQQLIEADGIILASPVYLQQVSGGMKTFFDRSCMWYHRPALAGKPVLALATTKGSGLKNTLNYLKSVAVQWGAIPAGAVGRSIFTQGRAVEEKEVAEFIRLLEQPQSFAPTLGQMMNFEVQKAMALSINQLDREYWIERRWTEQPYFFPCKINPLYRCISNMFGRFLQHKMKGAQIE